MTVVRAKKRFGQHFLKSPEVIARIIDIIAPRKGQVIIEIGPGHGALTAPLLESGAEVTAIELERDAVRFLSRKFGRHPHLRIVSQNFLTFEPSGLGLTRYTLVGNLPFGITSPVITWAINHRAQIEGVCLMVQRELALRLAATPGSKHWSPLSIFAQLHFDVVRCLDVPPRHFEPPPKVTATVITLTPREALSEVPTVQFDRVVRTAFRQRRKLLVNNLAPDLFRDPETVRAVLRGIGLSAYSRAEQVTTNQFLSLTKYMMDRGMLSDYTPEG
ncbi:MAG TPA: 16S rRNA (adenine(1518)-N(6)/adenine(1519)-N(6))-dimethyltransferase RsmA [Candidatus Deferrimicrobium sp.]|nr:16S rRNA (adenine(1518)-N(6)/adenine(1519)-N(6))-dimethyltransferase RsmA [Candidatus Deferrimicrobium sp.]